VQFYLQTVGLSAFQLLAGGLHTREVAGLKFAAPTGILDILRIVRIAASANECQSQPSAAVGWQE
jgi:hypothetical protein